MVVEAFPKVLYRCIFPYYKSMISEGKQAQNEAMSGLKQLRLFVMSTFPAAENMRSDGADG
jgi:hypothetical protein